MTTPRWSERLADELGVPVWRRRFASSPRSNVWLAELGSASVVVKEVVSDAFDREVAALRLASRVDPPVAPALLGVDGHVMVLEYVAGGPVPDDWPVAYARALRRLHDATSAGDDGALPRWSPPTRQDVDSFLAFARRFDVPVPATVESELDDLLSRLAPTRFSLLHGDPCPPNDMYTESGVRFVDLEQASLGDGATELAYLRIGFPTCWCSLALDPDLLSAAEAAYGECDVVDACAGWLLRGDALVQKAERDTVDHLALMSTQDWEWGTGTARQRVAHRLGVVAADQERMVALGRLATALREKMIARWPGLRPLPATRPRAAEPGAATAAP